jgi:GNAT superfamily N-acetyltransferase
LGEVRLATAEDRGDVVESVVEAFAQDPTMLWLFPDDYDRQVGDFFRYLFDRRVHDAEVWTAPGAGAALWEPPAGLPAGPDEEFDRLARSLLPEALARVQVYHHVMEDLIPTAGSWYLGVLAVRPQSQARGLGRRLLDAVRLRADAASEPIVLETAAPDNVALYEHWGFQVIENVTVPDHGPHVWIMRRPPGAGAW